MPRNGSNVYSPPADTLATTLTTIKSPNYNAFVNDVAADLNLARPVVAGGTGATSVASAQTSLSLDNKVVYTSKSGNYTALATDNNAVHRYTAAATVTLTAAATLGANWHYTVTADGGAVTIDPNGSETINDNLTLTVANGASVTIICDGTGFRTTARPNVWETVGFYTLSSVASLIVTDLGAARYLRLSGYLSFSGAAQLALQISTNNGSSFDVTAADYYTQDIRATGSTVSSAVNVAASGVLLATANLADASTPFSFSSNIMEFNKNALCTVTSESNQSTSGVRYIGATTSFHSAVAGRNAFRLLGGGTLTGSVLVERMVG